MALCSSLMLTEDGDWCTIRELKEVASRGHLSVSLYKIIFKFIVSESFHVQLVGFCFGDFETQPATSLPTSQL